MVCERMAVVSSSLFYRFSVQSSALYLPHKLHIAKEMVSSCRFISPYYLPALKQFQIRRKVCDCAGSTSPDFGDIRNVIFLQIFL